ncbi:O-acetyltransferase OatA [Dyadobacter sp. CECT 9275]|uniref:O-acetyltransferase OatA n=1 Tax=Dyadobacter helix TaxID=2822344 RepID=A0A916JHY5_9BACT|nr:acyltransferase [Dyadobacter sp. CECT 9275]CAG5008807.1 O-acetyltransferase OatA [Dyadobacter sp. CECT 9275]
MTKRYFPNLNGIRCIAALLVVFHHLEQAKEALHLPNVYEVPIIQHAGRLGVGLFFVLSGFLISFLLLSEKERYGNIDIKKFYLRRVFRIWPIYFLIVLLSLFVFPHIGLLSFPEIEKNITDHYTERLFLLMIVLPNYAFVLYDLPYWCAQTWSIGVEEQFYYLWPWLIKYTKKRIPIFLLFVTLTIVMLFLGLHFLNAPSREENLKIIATFIGQFRIQTMALGGFCAWLVFKDKEKVLSFIFRKDIQIATYGVLLLLFLSGVHFNGFLEVYSLFFGFFVLNLSCNPKSIISLENPVISYLGKISYGLYVYHVVVIVLLLNIFRNYFPLLQGPIYQILVYVLTLAGSIAVASVSYLYLEKPLLAFKDKRFGR